MQVQKKHFRSWLGGFDLAEGGLIEPVEPPLATGGYMSIFRRFVILTWEIRLNKLNKLKLNKLIAMSE